MEATAEDPAPLQVEEAGPLNLMNYDSFEALLPPHHPPQNPGSEETSEQRSGEQPLESHEVMELQAFSERKEWIMEKINVGIISPHPAPSPPDYFSEQLLDGMPPIELFADLDAVRTSSPAVSGLPTRKQLEGWLIEHDRIEKETEIFDSGELKKFKTFTMGQCRSVFLLPFPFLPFLNDRVCSGLKAEFISTRYRCHRAYFDDHIRFRQTPASLAGQVRELRSTRHPFDMGRTTLCCMGGPSSAVVRSAGFPLQACEMVSIRL